MGIDADFLTQISAILQWSWSIAISPLHGGAENPRLRRDN
jgi:hypothetical protein